MPTVIDTPELIEITQIDIHDLTIERPQARRARPGFWGMLAHRLTTHLKQNPRSLRRNSHRRKPPYRHFCAPRLRVFSSQIFQELL